MCGGLPVRDVEVPAVPDIPPARMSLTVIVADLLSQSRAAHQTYRKFAGTCDKKGNITQAYDEGRCVKAIELALSTRLEAHRIDPDHTDPEWKNDTVKHEELCEFYQRFLR
jgi:hypothetical protein